MDYSDYANQEGGSPYGQSGAREGMMSSNQGYDNASALQIRLDTSRILQEIENFMRGLEENHVWDKDKQMYITRLVQSGTPKANAVGIQHVMNFSRTLINPQVVQGNFVEYDDYINFIIEKRVELCISLIMNFYVYEISTEPDIDNITDFIMNLTEPFLSRLLFNEERKSYASTIRSTETNTLGQKNRGSFLDIFRK